ncbi:non-ribosomal peptide synthetase [Burkholderia oklahomensis]|uniref:non-ribosomal peptide synthetase n=7 Tax=Burkholderia oklahomensis TaxID=342113 RepID=UPI0005D733B4|nr:non-ribosomal peptide synthetase [Burkholderia oklahomensis]AJX35693.1 D-alanine--poly(phosphoribitol) ligase, subunit 1 [Burkholderia oklahomensis C6786]AOI49026.1 non-ribosomal peptide synthetase [Burkholderia oklahomensis C6786]KUY61069.1 non-ribosomal peptide synthetase [Burkholderia oklahomensis C6786]
MTAFGNFVDLCTHRAAANGDALAYRYLSPHDEDRALSFGALDLAARRIAARLAASGTPGDRVLIVCPQSLDYVSAFFGCLYGGFIAVPAYAPRNNHHFERLSKIIEDAQPRVVMLCRKQYAAVHAFIEQNPPLRAVELVVVDELDDVDPAGCRPHAAARDDVAFLQYTSGSTGQAKGIMVSHGNLLANEEMIRTTCGNTPDSRAVFWLPLFHDMGLMTLLQGVYVGYPTYLMAPMDFLANPLRWLQAVSSFRATLTVAPNFAWQLCVEKISPEQLDGLDLSSVTAAVNGSEPISVRTLDSFVARFGACGFRRDAFRPSYGLAEATLLVTGSSGHAPSGVIEETMVSSGGRRTVFQRVGCGRPAAGCDVAIVERDTRAVRRDGEVGEIWVKGPHVAQGYWNNPEQTAQTFGNRTADGAGPYLATGDLGFLHDGALVVTGRCKDVIILRGDNYYPSDLEATATAAHPALVPDGAAAFTLAGDDAAPDDAAAQALAVVAEVRRNTPSAQFAEIAAAIVERISAGYGLALERLVLIRERSIPKTSSGKVQRGAVRAELDDGRLKTLHDVRPGETGVRAAAQPFAELHAMLAAARGDGFARIVDGFVLSQFAEIMKTPFYALDLTRPVAALGLDSLALVNVQHRLGAALKIDAPAELLFGDATLGELAAQIGALAQRAWAEPADSAEATAALGEAAQLASAASAAPSAAADAGFESTSAVAGWNATPGQAALWLIQQADRESRDYNEGFVAAVDGAFDPELFMLALARLAARHDALRVTFAEVDGRPVAREADALEQSTVRSADDAAALRTARDALAAPFDLSRATWRAVLAKGPSATYVVLALHHAIVDMWSFDILIAELKQLYDALARGADVSLAAAGGYREFAAWQRGWLNSPEAARHAAYWRDRLRGMPARSAFPSTSTSISTPARDASAGARAHRFAIDARTMDAVRALAQRHGLTTYHVLFAAGALLLGRYAGQRDVVVGMPAHGRPRAADARTIGYFANVLPIRIALDDRKPLAGWLHDVKDAIVGGLRHQALPLPVLAEALALERGAQDGALVQTVISLLAPNAARADARAADDAADAGDRLSPFALGEAGGRLALGDATLTSCESRHERAPFDVAFTLIDDDGGLAASIGYRADRHPAAMIERLAANYRCVLEALAHAAPARLGDVPHVSAAERELLRRSLTHRALAPASAAGGDGDSVVDRFRRTAARQPDAIALAGTARTLTYGELARASDALAHVLLDNGVAPGDRVVVAVGERATQTLLALATLKVGAAYVPVDLANPPERLAYLLNDCGAKRVLTTRRDRSSLPATGADIVCADELDDATLARHAGRPLPRIAIAAGQPAYCIYTSGSTGQPKGVLVTHGGLANLVDWHVGAFALDAGARAAMLAGPGFDAAVWEIWPALCAGASLAEPAPDARHDVAELARWLDAHAISHCFMPTPLAEAFIAAAARPRALRFLLTGGDQLKARGRADDGFRLINAYGPTENTVVTTSGAVEPVHGDDAYDRLAPLPDIGAPIRGQSLHILDAQLRPTPLGVSGELYVSGAGLALGYLNRPALTAERFVPAPDACASGVESPGVESPGSRMYATGDIVRLDESGRLHFVGRADDQVQIRGFRVEPGEIEAALAAHPGVAQCKVIAFEREPSGKLLAAYVAGDASLTEAALRTFVDSRLPSYMRPAAFVIVDALPLDANGKISRRALPSPALAAGDEAAFADPVAQAVARVYQDVLGCGPVRADDDFFALGGHSLLVARVASGIRARLGITVSIADLFAHSKVAALAAHLRGEAAAPILPPGRLTRAGRPARVPLSPAQQRMWLLQALEPDSTDYHVCGALRVRGALDLDRLAAALTQTVARHEALRTCFPKQDGEACQVVLPPAPVDVERLSLDVGGASPAARDAAVQARIDAWEAQRFDLETGPLIKAAYLPLADDDGYLLLNLHHIVADGRSIAILLDDIAARYAGLRGDAAGADALDAPNAPHYADYCVWSRSEAAREREAASLPFWRTQLAGELPAGIAALRTTRAAAALDTQDAPGARPGGEVGDTLPADLAEQIRDAAARWGVTESTVYLAAYGLLVAKFGGDADVLIGIAYAGRDLPDTADMIGMFVNVLPIRVEVGDADAFERQVRGWRDACVRAFRHAHVSYERMVELAGGDRRDGAGELVKAMFDFEERGLLPLALGDAQLRVERRPDRSAKFDLTLRCSPDADARMRIALNFRRAALSVGRARRLLDAYRLILEQVLQTPDLTPARTRLVDDAQADALLRLGGGPAAPWSGAPVHRQIERIAHADPDALAIAGEDGARIGYAVFNAVANRLARRLRALGVAPRDGVALCMRPGPSFALAALAVLKLGAAYVPIDPRYPDPRKLRIVADSGARLVVTEPDAAPAQTPDAAALVWWDALAVEAATLPDGDLGIETAPDDLAYIVYTSGTTGAPKGVEIPHRGLANLCQWHARAYGLHDAPRSIRASQTAGIGFDAAVWEIWPYLCTGASVWFAPDAARQSSRRLEDWLTAQRITHCFVATPLAHAVLADGWLGSPSLAYLLTGGERLTRRAPAGARYRLFNHYGPSENSVVATAGEVAQVAGGEPPSIGAALDNVRVYVLDRHGQLAPRGVPGELCIGGASLMRGYRSNDALTRARLVADPFAGVPDARMYRTGDLVCWNDAGELDYVGRADNQVKIRGHRIEPSEILHAVKSDAGVYDAVVTTVDHPQAGPQLVAYVVFDPARAAGAPDRAARVKRAIAAQLPEFMVPAHIVELDALPLTSNGKVDYAALPAPRAANADARRTPLRTETERALAGIWGELLGEPVDDAHANFFALGGHSLLAARAVALIETRLAREIALKDFFAAEDLAALARALDAAGAYAGIPAAPAGAPVPLSPYQQRLWLVQAFNRGSVDYNVVGALRVTGALDPARFRAAVSAVVERHEILRTRIVDTGDGPRQRAPDGDAREADLLQMNLTGNPPSMQDGFVRDYLARMAVEPFDLAAGPLFKLVLIQTAADSAVLAVSFHHIVVDAWSANVFLRDLLECYAAQRAQRAPRLAPLPIQYKDYSVWAQHALARSEDALRAFWRDYLHALPAHAPLPVARRGADVADAAARAGRRLSVAWPADTLARLKALARREQASLYEVLIAAYFAWLHRLSGQADLVVGMPYNDRGRAELENLVGFFVNVLPVRARVRPHLSYAALLRQVRDDLRRVYRHHALPFDRIAEQCTDAAGSLFQTMFDLQAEPLAAGGGSERGGLRAELLDGAPEAPVADLSVTFREAADGLTLSCVYAAERFDAPAVERWLDNFRALLDGVATDADQAVGRLAFLTADEQAIVDRLRNAASVDHRGVLAEAGGAAGPALLHRLVDRWATVAPADPALVSPVETLSFAELARRTDRLAGILWEEGVRPGMVVGVEAAHGVDAVLGIIATIKAGAICFPVDVRLPPDRLDAVIADSGCRHVLASAGAPLGRFDGKRLALDGAAWRTRDAVAPAIDATPDHGVFLTYTSGTTGAPKASVLHHRGIVNYIGTVVERFGYARGDRAMLFAPLTFDASLEEIFAPLCAGASLYIGDENVKRSVPALVDTCRAQRISVLTLPTAYWRVLSEHLAASGGAAELGAVRLVSIGGEKVTLEAIRQWHRATAGRIALYNIYGPSECSIGSIVDRIDVERALEDGEVYLHHPVANAHLHVLDACLNPVPADMPGELYIGGVGVAHGYHGRPALTAQRFVADPFAAAPGARLYRSGDLVRYDLEGRLHYLGRTDFQVKVDGIRVEPEEIQAVLESHPEVAQAVVLAGEARHARNPLIGYVILEKAPAGARAATGTDGAAFVDFLRARLPAHMVPTQVVVMDAFPLTTNQKVDRRALLLAANDSVVAAPALSATETALLALWRELLGDDTFGIDDNFFSLGGSSLLAIRINSRVEAMYAVRLPVAALFDCPTVRALAVLVERLRASRDAVLDEAAQPIERIDARATPLSGAQYRLWYLHQRDPDSTAYHLPDLLKLAGPLDAAALRTALARTLDEHESLRTTFVIEGETPLQVIAAQAQPRLDVHDLSALAPDARDAALDALVRRALDTPFDLARGPLATFALATLAHDEHVLLSVFHHIVVDGWSVGLFQRSLARHYNAARGGRASAQSADDASPRALQYRDFAAWHRRVLDGGERERQLDYWLAQLDGTLPVLQLPTDFNRPPQASGSGEAFSFELDAALAARLQAVAQRHHVSMFMLLLAAYAALLARYARQDDLLIGVPALGRTRPEFESVVGFFVNTLVIRVRANPSMTFASLLEHVRATCLDAFDHQDVALEEIAAGVNARRERDGGGLFQTMFSYQEADALEPAAFDGLVATSVEPEHRSAKFDLYLATWAQDGRLHGGFEFSTDLFEAATVRRMADHYRNLLAGVAAHPDGALHALPLLGDDERAYQVRTLNQASRPLPDGVYVRDLFARQAALHPARVAATCGAASLTYGELDRASDRVARNLLAAGARGEDLVGLLIGRNLDYLVAMLGVLKAGVAFTPMNPDDPTHKLDRIAELGNVRYVVHDAASADRAHALTTQAARLALDALLREPAAAVDFLPLAPSSLAYVIYTSGSTGQPKGAMIEQLGMLNHLLAKIGDLAIGADDVVAEMAVTTFDVSIWQYLVALLAGGRTAVMPGDAAWDPQQLFAQLDADGVTVFESVPSHMKILIDELEARPGHHRLDRVRVYVSNAEALTPALCARWFACAPHIPVVNTYGATECSDDTSHLWIRAPLSTAFPYVPIQGTLPNLTTYLLDERLEPVPVGVTGEVYIGGVGVGRGYLGDPARTARAFVPDPFSPEPGRRLYKTGDLARYRPGGTLEFLGREDFQVKIRGQRVEIGEVEKAIGDHDNVRQAVVAAARDGKDRLYLLGYVIPHRHPAPTVAELRAFVAGRVASYMVPASFVLMDEFPLNANGKVDRKRLPKPADQDIFRRNEHVAPATQTEARLAELWRELLDVDEIGALDSFFELGGHSLVAAELTLRIRTLFGVALPLRTLFQSPRLRDVAAALDALRTSADAAGPARIERLPARAHYELAPCQVPEWYAYQMDPTSPVYNISVADLFFTGKLNRDAFVAAWRTILDRHDVLRVKFDYRDGAPIQIVDPAIDIRADDVFLDRTTLAGADAIDEANRLGARFGTAPFDFANGPLFRLHVASYAGDFHQLIFVVHHIIWDETSLINLMLELSELYNAHAAGRAPNVPAIEVGYFDYVQWMHQQLRSGAFDEHKRYWLDMYRTLPPPLDLPTDRPRPNLMSYRGDALRTWLPRGVVRKIDAYLKQHDVTLFMLQLAILDCYLSRISGQRDFVIGCPIAGRADARLKPLLGLFATPMPIRCTIGENMTFGELLAQVSQRTLEAFEHYHYPSNQVIEQLQHEKDLSRPKLFSIMYGVQNNKTDLMGRLKFDGLALSLENVIDTENKSSRFDLNFVVDQFGSDIMFSCIYNADLFDASTIEQMLDNMTALMDQVLDDPDEPLSRYTMVGANGNPPAVLHGPRVDYDGTATMHALMAGQAARTPAGTALVAEGVEYDYETLNRQANRLAHYLLSLGVASGDNVAVMLRPSFEMVVALYAILKVGGAFVPIGTQYPQKRVDAILRNAGARWALTQSGQRRAFAAFPYDVVCVDDVMGALGGYSDRNPPPVDPRQLAYVLHTSGSTGVPKGIEIEHRGVVSMLADLQRTYRLDANDRVLFHTPFTFDVFIQDVFWPLASGARVVVMGDDALKSAHGFADVIERERVTLAQFVPAMLETLVDARERGEIAGLASLRQVICGAAALYRGLAERFARAFDCRLANHYGPTEVTVDASRFDCGEPFAGDTVPIGRPVGNASLHVLDAHLQPVPRGVIGEICVASPGLARRYLNDDEGTARAFVEVVVDGAPLRLYRTGDLGHCDRTGVVYFHGRADKQLKIRGNRVELDEIGSALRGHPAIAAAALQYREDAAHGGRLVAYVEQAAIDHQVPAGPGGAPLYAFTLEQRPELAAAALASLPGAPDDSDSARELARRFPACQLVVTDGASAVTAFCQAVPLRIEATAGGDAPSAAPALGRDAARRLALAQQDDGVEPNALYVLDDAATGALATPPAARAALLAQWRRLAAALGLARLLLASAGGGAAAEPADALGQGAGARAYLTRDAVRAWLRQSLPDYMIPDQVHFIPAIPLTDSGKVDARNLPVIEADERPGREAASTALQRELIDVWERLLQVEQIGVTDDFFVLGGQSLKAIEMVAEVGRRYGVKIQLRQFYENPTIRYLETLLTGRA